MLAGLVIAVVIFESQCADFEERTRSEFEGNYCGLVVNYPFSAVVKFIPHECQRLSWNVFHCDESKTENMFIISRECMSYDAWNGYIRLLGQKPHRRDLGLHLLVDKLNSNSTNDRKLDNPFRSILKPNPK